MRKDVYLLLSFGDNAWGRSSAACALGEDLRRRGREVRVVAGKAGAGSFGGSALRVEILPDLAGALLQIYFEDLLDRLAPAGVVFCDGDSVLHALRRWGLDPGLFERTGARVFGIDTWSHDETGHEADVFGEGMQQMEPWPEWLIPIKIAPLGRIGGVDEVFSGLPHPRALRRRASLRRFAMISTAAWQHADLKSNRGARVQREVPALLAAAVGAVADLDLVHVGPEPLQGFQSLGARYRWMGVLSPTEYIQRMAVSAVYVSLSPVCAAQMKALCVGVPVLLVQHMDDSAAAEDLPYPFRIWPLGYSRFLEPVLRDNPVLDAVAVVELSRSAELIRSLRDLAFEGVERRAALARQVSYVKKLKALRRSESCIIERCEGIIRYAEEPLAT